MESGDWDVNIAEYVRQSLATIAQAVANGYGGAWRERPEHKSAEALRCWLQGQADDIQKSFEHFRVIDLLEELRLHYWGNAAIELSSVLPGLQIRREFVNIVYRRRDEVFFDKWNREGHLFRLASADVTRTVSVECVEPAYRLLYPLMEQKGRDWVDGAIADGDAYSVAYKTMRAKQEIGESTVTKMLAPQPPQQKAPPGIGCDLLLTYYEKWVVTDEEYGPDNPVGGFYIGDAAGVAGPPPKQTRILAGSSRQQLRDLIARIVVGDLLEHDLRHSGAYRI